MGWKKWLKKAKAVTTVVFPTETVANMAWVKGKDLPAAAVLDPVGYAISKAPVLRELPHPSLAMVVEEFADELDDFLACVAANILFPGITVALAAYRRDLRKQAEGRWRKIPKPLRVRMQPHYSIDLGKVRYADRINIRNGGTGIVFGNEMFLSPTMEWGLNWPGAMENPVAWLIHESVHCEQYERIGGVSKFICKYANELLTGLATEGAVDMVTQQGIDLGRIPSLEKAAYRRQQELAEGFYPSFNRSLAKSRAIEARAVYHGNELELVWDAMPERVHESGCEIQLWNLFEGGRNQEWRFQEIGAGSGFYKIRNLASGLVLEAVPTEVSTDGGRIRLQDDLNRNNDPGKHHHQQWEPSLMPEMQRVQIKCRAGAGLVIDTAERKVANGTRLVLRRAESRHVEDWMVLSPTSDVR